MIKSLSGLTDTTGMNVTPTQFGVIQKLMDAATFRHEVISQNIANVNTPGYQRQYVTFEGEWDRAVQLGDQGSLAGLSLEVRKDSGGAQRADGNNVDIDTEMGDLNKNGLLYEALTQVLASKMANMRAAITGRS